MFATDSGFINQAARDRHYRTGLAVRYPACYARCYRDQSPEKCRFEYGFIHCGAAQQVPALYEAARIDGAGRIRIFPNYRTHDHADDF